MKGRRRIHSRRTCLLAAAGSALLLLSDPAWCASLEEREGPDASVVRGGLPEDFGSRVLADAGHAYAIYVSPAVQPRNYAPDPNRAARSFALELNLPEGVYAAEWLNPGSGRIERREVIRSAGRVVVNSPEFKEDLALRIKRDASGEAPP